MQRKLVLDSFHIEIGLALQIFRSLLLYSKCRKSLFYSRPDFMTSASLALIDSFDFFDFLGAIFYLRGNCISAHYIQHAQKNHSQINEPRQNISSKSHLGFLTLFNVTSRQGEPEFTFNLQISDFPEEIKESFFAFVTNAPEKKREKQIKHGMVLLQVGRKKSLTEILTSTKKKGTTMSPL